MPDFLNPHYNEPGVFYDSGFFYADGVADVTQPKPRSKHPMSALKLDLFRKNPAELIALADTVLAKIAPAAPATPPIPNLAGKAASLLTARDATDAANQAYEDARAALRNLKAVRDARADDLRMAHTATGKAIESECNGNAELLSASGYALASAATPGVSGPPAQIKNLAVTQGDADGSVDVSFDPDARAKTYEIEITTVDPVVGPWAKKAQPTASKDTLTGLVSGQRVWVRVRGIGSKGEGAWSDPATKIVP